MSATILKKFFVQVGGLNPLCAGEVIAKFDDIQLYITETINVESEQYEVGEKLLPLEQFVSNGFNFFGTNIEAMVFLQAKKEEFAKFKAKEARDKKKADKQLKDKQS